MKQCQAEYMQRKKASFRCAVPRAIGPHDDSDEMDPEELARRIRVYQHRAANRLPLFQKQDRPERWSE